MQRERPKAVFARRALTAKGWQQDVRIGFGADGMIASVEAGSSAGPGMPSFDLLLPGMANVHSHAFQRAMIGLTERASGEGKDNFWSWREVMYRFVGTLTPEHIEHITRYFYIELLKHGYTAVGEFHYLHHDVGGTPYKSPDELSQRIIGAATDSGIYLTHLPVMYETSNFGGLPPVDGQRRFIHNLDGYLALLESLTQSCQKAGFTLGIAPHSLRAVTPETLEAIINALPALALESCPIHMHVSEQEKEVADCLAWSGKRPVEWLLEHEHANKRWCLIHATHMAGEEIQKAAKSGAVVGMCPTTEANLGDGITPAEEYLAAGGRFGIGSDSQVCVSPWVELRQLEYGQRLAKRMRNVLCDPAIASVGRNLYVKAATGGAQALGIKGGAIEAGRRADLIAFSMEANPLLADKKEDEILDACIFSLAPAPGDVFVGGVHVIHDGKHRLEEKSAADWKKTMQALRNDF